MKKPKTRDRRFTKKTNEKYRMACARVSNLARHTKVRRRLKIAKHERLYRVDLERINARRIIFNRLCKAFTFNKKPVEVAIVGGFGLEEKQGFLPYLEKCSEFVDFNSKFLTINFSGCTRVWPSAVTMLCSLWQWVQLASRHGEKPIISQVASVDEKVNSYMYHCGLYDYVKIKKIENTSHYNEEDVVKIIKEMKKSDIEAREDQIMSLIERHTDYNRDELEWFNSVLLTEIFNNVTEHGISHKCKGWWTLAQYHKNHKLISLCIADNGIGIRNTLMTGPQRNELIKDIPDSPEFDGDCIKKAMEENISGAISASIKTDGFLYFKKYSSGARRGNGLKRIQDCCGSLGVELTILSHHGYISCDHAGRVVSCGSLPRRVVAGTMYHLAIPAS